MNEIMYDLFDKRVHKYIDRITGGWNIEKYRNLLKEIPNMGGIEEKLAEKIQEAEIKKNKWDFSRSIHCSGLWNIG